ACGRSTTMQYYSLPGLRAYLAGALSRIEAEMESEATPVIERRAFPFVTDQKLRDIIERDFDEVQRAAVSRCWKSVIVLCGGLIEAILLDLVHRDEARARAATKAPKEAALLRWDLA